MLQKKLAAVLLIIIIGFAAYINSLNCEFVWDDRLLVTENPDIKSWSHLPQIFARNIGAGAGSKNIAYRPLQILTYMIDYSLWGLNVRGFHLTSILLHILVALSIYRLVNILYGDSLLSFLTGILFVVHPIHTEAITYISGRADPLAVLFMLLCFIFYIQQLSTRSISGFILMLLSYLLALLAKEYSLILPVILLLYHYSFKKKFRIKLYLPLLIIVLVYILLRTAIIRSFYPPPTSYSGTLFTRIPGFFAAVFNYLKLMLLPLDLHMEYGNRLFKFTNPRAIAGLIIFCLSLFFLAKKRNAAGTAFFSLAWFFTALLPVSNLYPVNAYMAEHWLYFPSIVFFLVLAKGLNHLYKVKNFRILTAALTISLLTVYLSLTIKQNHYWKTPIAFYERTLKYAPNSARLCNDLGIAYKDLGKIDDAIVSCRKALEIDPSYAKARINLGAAYSEKGLTDEAIAEFKKILEIDSDEETARNNLGLAYTNKGLYDEAVAEFKKALEIRPDYALAHFNLGVAYDRKGQFDHALGAYMTALKLNPDDAEAHYNLGALFQKTGKSARAIAEYESVLKLNPSYSLAWNNLGTLYAEDKSIEKAFDCFRKALAQNPDLTIAWKNLGNVYAAQARNRETLDAYQEVLARKPDDIDSLFRTASIYYQLGRTEETINSYQRLLALKPDHATALNNLGYIYVAEGIDLEKGISLIKKSVSLQPDVPYFLDSLGWAYHKLGNLQEARRHLERAASLDPENPLIQEHLRKVKEAEPK